MFGTFCRLVAIGSFGIRAVCFRNSGGDHAQVTCRSSRRGINGFGLGFLGKIIIKVQRRESMVKVSDMFILIAVLISFAVSAYLWFSGNKEEGLFTATWVTSILCFGIYFNVLALRGAKK